MAAPLDSLIGEGLAPSPYAEARKAQVFAGMMLSRGHVWDDPDWQDTALSCGLLYAHPVADDVPEDGRCSACIGECGECYRLTAAGSEAVKAFNEEVARESAESNS